LACENEHNQADALTVTQKEMWVAPASKSQKGQTVLGRATDAGKEPIFCVAASESGAKPQISCLPPTLTSLATPVSKCISAQQLQNGGPNRGMLWWCRAQRTHFRAWKMEQTKAVTMILGVTGADNVSNRDRGRPFRLSDRILWGGY